MAALVNKLENLRDSFQGYENKRENTRTSCVLDAKTNLYFYESDAF
jgi:hypothetical protein